MVACSLSELLPRQGESYTRTQQTANKTQRYIQTHLFWSGIHELLTTCDCTMQWKNTMSWRQRIAILFLFLSKSWLCLLFPVLKTLLLQECFLRVMIKTLPTVDQDSFCSGSIRLTSCPALVRLQAYGRQQLAAGWLNALNAKSTQFFVINIPVWCLFLSWRK